MSSTSSTSYTLPLPPSFYTALQNTHYTFPHENGDVMTDAELRGYWWDNYLFADYCDNTETWRTKRETDIVGILVPFYMRCKCLAEHLDFQHAIPASSFSPRIREKVAGQLTDVFRAEVGAFQFDLDRCITVTQILLYWYLRDGGGKELAKAKEGEELCGKWREAVGTVKFARPGLSQLRHMPAYASRLKEIMQEFAALRKLVAEVHIDSKMPTACPPRAHRMPTADQ